MKHLCIFLLVFNMGLNAAVHSQNQRVSVKLKNAGIEDLIVAIKSQCDMGFLYDYGKTKAVKNIWIWDRARSVSSRTIPIPFST